MRDSIPLVQIPLASPARWLWTHDLNGANSYAEFRQKAYLATLPTEAWIQLSAETSLRLCVNDTLIYSGPPREVPPYFYFDTVDLVPHLKIGSNEIRILAHHQGANSQSYQAGTPAILVAGRCIVDRSLFLDFSESRNWKSRPVTRYLRDAHRLFECIGFSEHVNFDETEAVWSPVIEVATHPWTERPTALPRDFPALAETVRKAGTSKPHSGGWLVDFGGEVSGYVELKLVSSRTVTARISYAEELIDDRVWPGKAGMAYYDVLELRAQEVTWRSYEKRAFRYLQISEPLEHVEASVIEQNYPYQARYTQIPAFHQNENSEEGRLINRIYEVSARTIELNSEDILTDCPWRERGQYFDCNFYMEAMQFLFGTLAPIRRFLNQFPRGADQTGLLRMCYPSPQGFSTIPDFSISYAIQLSRYLEISGDLDTVRHNLRFAERGVTAYRDLEDGDNMLVNVPGWIFIDNTFELPKFPRSAALNAVYYGGYRALDSLFRACGQPSRATTFESHAAKIRAGFRKTFVREDRVLDSDSTPSHEAFRYWNYHYSAETGRWYGKSFRLRTLFCLEGHTHPLRLAVNGPGRAWIDGRLVGDIAEGGSWTSSALYQSTELSTPSNAGWHRLDLEVGSSGIDWECYLSCAGAVNWAPLSIWEEPAYGMNEPSESLPPNAVKSRLRNHSLPWMTQATVGHAAFHGLLEADEARRFLQACLPANYCFEFAKRTTPFFAKIDDTPDPRRILPCNVPASMFHFCHALKRHGMGNEAKALLLLIYRGMLERGATTWWEEWNTRSSLCHAWASFVVNFLDVTPTARYRPDCLHEG